MEMPIYYLIDLILYPYSSFRLTKCYLIKEGYIPIQDYRENPNDLYYSAGYSREQFCVSSNNIFSTLPDAINFCSIFIKKQFYIDIENLIKSREKHLLYLKELK